MISMKRVAIPYAFTDVCAQRPFTAALTLNDLPSRVAALPVEKPPNLSKSDVLPGLRG
jgi:hypothetical protein